MIIPILIAFRESLEASLILAVLIGILKKFGYKNHIRIVKKATVGALLTSLILLIIVSLLGQKTVNYITEGSKETFEGIMLIISTVFITWAIFWLHQHLRLRRGKQVILLHERIKSGNFNGFTFLVFTLVFREGIEIVIFLSTLIFSSSPFVLISGSVIGIISASILGYFVYTTAVKIKLQKIFTVTTILLILFSAGLLLRGIGSLTEAHILPHSNFMLLNLPLFPFRNSFMSEIIKTFLGISPTLSFAQYLSYILYLIFIYFGLTRSSNNKPVNYVSKAN